MKRGKASRKGFDEKLRRAASFLKEAAERLEAEATVDETTGRTREEAAVASVIMGMGAMCDALDRAPVSTKAALQRVLLVSGVRECLCAMTCIGGARQLPEMADQAVEYVEAARASVGLSYLYASPG
jgi:hypothetical protein